METLIARQISAVARNEYNCCTTKAVKTTTKNSMFDVFVDQGYFCVDQVDAASVFAGCLYTYTGTEQHYCFKEIPTLNAKLDAAMPSYNVSRPCLENFPGITTMPEEEQASLCCGHQVAGDIAIS